MTWALQHRTGRWWIGRGDNRSSEPWKLTRYRVDAARFPSPTEAAAMAMEFFPDFGQAYECIHLEDAPSVTDADGFPWAGNAS